jgi:hypothetical protein
MKPERTLALVIVSLGLGLLGGCTQNPTGTGAATGGKFFAVTTDSTAFYHYGPQQGNGPDKKLTKDTLMRLIRPSFGYAKVQLTTGEQGFVASDDIRAAPATLVAALTATPAPVAQVRLATPEPFPPPPDSLPEFEPTPIPGSPPPRK